MQQQVVVTENATTEQSIQTKHSSHYHHKPIIMAQPGMSRNGPPITVLRRKRHIEHYQEPKKVTPTLGDIRAVVPSLIGDKKRPILHKSRNHQQAKAVTANEWI